MESVCGRITTLCVLILSLLQCIRTEPTSSQSWITDCERTKACFRHPADCVEIVSNSEDVNYGGGTSCEFVVTWEETFDQNSVNFEVYAPVVDDLEYIAIAFSENTKMVSIVFRRMMAFKT